MLPLLVILGDVGAVAWGVVDELEDTPCMLIGREAWPVPDDEACRDALRERKLRVAANAPPLGVPALLETDGVLL